MLEGILDFFEFDNPSLYIVWIIGMGVLGYMLKTLTKRPELFSTWKLIGIGVIGAPLLLIVSQFFINRQR